eukprot:5203900-Amphidinium_carterae.1
MEIEDAPEAMSAESSMRRQSSAALSEGAKVQRKKTRSGDSAFGRADQEDRRPLGGRTVERGCLLRLPSPLSEEDVVLVKVRNTANTIAVLCCYVLAAGRRTTARFVLTFGLVPGLCSSMLLGRCATKGVLVEARDASHAGQGLQLQRCNRGCQRLLLILTKPQRLDTFAVACPCNNALLWIGTIHVRNSSSRSGSEREVLARSRKLECKYANAVLIAGVLHVQAPKYLDAFGPAAALLKTAIRLQVSVLEPDFVLAPNGVRIH